MRQQTLKSPPLGTRAGMPWDERLWPGAWAAATRVWASPWRPQAAAGLAAARVPRRDLRMAVLVQQLVPARYAFVAHTTHPTTGARPAPAAARPRRAAACALGPAKRSAGARLWRAPAAPGRTSDRGRTQGQGAGWRRAPPLCTPRRRP